MTKVLPLLALGAATLLLGGCATSMVCGNDTDYLDAPSITPISGANGVAVPNSPSALVIPAGTGQETAVAQSSNLNRRTSCLDFPPEVASSSAK